MFKKLVILAVACIIFVAAAPAAQSEDESKPEPYSFAFEEKNANHTLTREESGDEQGVVKGRYSYIDLNGITRVVTYVADPVTGFTAQIESNEPGLVAHAPAGATYTLQ